MSNIVGQAANKVIDLADGATDSALDVLEATLDLAVAAVGAPIRVGDQWADSMIGEAKGLKAKAIALLREVANAVSEPLP